MPKVRSQPPIQVFEIYFDKLFLGNFKQLKLCFLTESPLFGDSEGQEYHKYVDIREHPNQRVEILKIEVGQPKVLGKSAIGQFRLPRLGFNDYGFLSFFKQNTERKIVNKLVAYVA